MTDDATPVLVGCARLTQRVEEPGGGLDAVDLMTEVVRSALTDAGASALARRIGLIAVPSGMWRCTDPGRVIAERIGAPTARTIVAEVGVLQHTLVHRACELIASGQIDAAIVCGGDARYRQIVASRAGLTATEHPGPEAVPDEVLHPSRPVVSSFEIERGIVMPAVQYSIFESALAHYNGLSSDEERTRLGCLWEGYARVAAGDANAWDRSAPGANEIVTASDDNRMVAVPYTRLLCSQWNVDQAAALVFVSAALARELRVPTQRWVFPLAGAESNAMIPTIERRDIHRWPAFAHTGRGALDLAGVALPDVELMEIYSCFPSAVQVQCAELGVSLDRPLTVTGGMTFGGGPLNNFVLQATVAMMERLRDGDGVTGVVTGVSGLLTKPGVTVWSSVPPAGSFRFADLADETVRDTPTVPVAADGTGPATIIGATVSYGRNEPPEAIAILELDDGARTVASCEGSDEIELVERSDAVGGRVTVVAPGRFSL